VRNSLKLHFSAVFRRSESHPGVLKELFFSDFAVTMKIKRSTIWK
jgi:hypothetical protein